MVEVGTDGKLSPREALEKLHFSRSKADPSLTHKHDISRRLKKTKLDPDNAWQHFKESKEDRGNISVRLKETLLFDPDNAWQHFNLSRV